MEVESGHLAPEDHLEDNATGLNCGSLVQGFRQVNHWHRNSNDEALERWTYATLSRQEAQLVGASKCSPGQ